VSATVEQVAWATAVIGELNQLTASSPALTSAMRVATLANLLARRESR